jgi:hypothetical protein
MFIIIRNLDLSVIAFVSKGFDVKRESSDRVGGRIKTDVIDGSDNLALCC